MEFVRLIVNADNVPMTLADLIRMHAKLRPDQPALTEGTRTVTFAELDRRSSQVAQAMLARGVGPADRVAIISRNCIAYYESILAVSKIGAVIAGVNFRLAADEVAWVMTDAEPKLVLVSEECVNLVPEGIQKVTLGAEYETWLGASEDTDPELSSPDDIVLQLYSSGTTGAPKGAMLTNANLLWTVRMGRESYQASDESVNLLTSPLFHVGGVGYSLMTFGNGGHSVFALDLVPDNVLDLIERHHVTHVFLVPTVIRYLLDALPTRPTDLSSLEVIAYGGAPIDDGMLLEALAAFQCRFLGVYGMTEAAGSVTALVHEDHDPDGPRSRLLRSVGKALPWHEVSIMDPVTSLELEPDVIGEICVRSPQVMAGYWRQEKLNASTITDDGWLRTGDVGWRDSEGYIFVHDRLKDIVITGGENVYPGEVERVLITYPGVSEVIVIGVPDPVWGETVKAIVVPTPDSNLSEAEMIRYAREHLAHFKCPTSLDFVAQLPRNASGKVLKRVVRQSYLPTSTEGVSS